MQPKSHQLKISLFGVQENNLLNVMLKQRIGDGYHCCENPEDEILDIFAKCLSLKKHVLACLCDILASTFKLCSSITKVMPTGEMILQRCTRPSKSSSRYWRIHFMIKTDIYPWRKMAELLPPWAEPTIRYKTSPT